MEKLMGIVEGLAESAESRAKDIHWRYEASLNAIDKAAFLNDFFYWSGKATAYRGIIAMVELQRVVDDELDTEGSCP